MERAVDYLRLEGWRALELKDADRKRFLALLLDAVLDGTVGYTSTYRT
jgi:hypothetical protein